MAKSTALPARFVGLTLRPSRELVNVLLANSCAREGSVALATGVQREVTLFGSFSALEKNVWIIVTVINAPALIGCNDC